MKFVNLTGHPVTVQRPDGQRVTYPSQGRLRAPMQFENVGEVDGVPLVVRQPEGSGPNLPEFEEGTFYIVSPIVLECRPDRADLVAPDTSDGSAVREARAVLKHQPVVLVAVRRFLVTKALAAKLAADQWHDHVVELRSYRQRGH